MIHELKLLPVFLAIAKKMIEELKFLSVFLIYQKNDEKRF